MKKHSSRRTRPCRSDDRFVAYVRGELSATERTELDHHARTCPECRLRLASFRTAGAALDRMFTKSPRRRDVAPAQKLLGALLTQIPERTLYYHSRRFTDFGPILAAATERGLCFVSFRDAAEEEYLDRWAQADFTVIRSEPALSETMRQLDEYFRRRRQRFDLPLDLSFATEFTRRVLEATAKVRFGEVRTYREIAVAISKPRATRAVGNALGRNPIPIVIPCHRVVAADGLGGFTGGLDFKRRLLATEGIDVDAGDLFA